MSTVILETESIDDYKNLTANLVESDIYIDLTDKIQAVTSEPELEVTVQKKAFTIVDDNLFIADYINSDDAPYWLKNLISISVSNKIDGSNQDLLDNISMLVNNLANTYVPANQYTQAITDLNNKNQNALQLITALDSTFADKLGSANSKIINLETTKANLSEVDTRVVTVLNSELVKEGSNINTTIGSLNQAISTETYSRGIQYNGLVSSIDSLDNGLVANATATTNLYTFVGVNQDGTETGGGLLANSSAITNLTADLGSLEGTVSAQGQELSTVNTRITDGLTSAESKWAYNSSLTLNGVSYNSGFGIATSAISGSGIASGSSEFWVNADKIRFTNTANSGRNTPFSIDASGPTPEVYFNGRVTFNNVSGGQNAVDTAANNALNTAKSYTDTKVANIDVSSSINNNNDVFAQKLGYANYAAMVNAANNGQTIVNGGYIRTSLIQSDQIIAGGLSSNIIIGNTISGSTITGSKIYGAQIEGSIIKASFIDLTSTATLTNWQQYTPSNYPSQYAENFAHNNDGSLVVDSLGYVRLMGNTNINVPAYTSPVPYEFGLYPFNSYKNSNINRCISENITMYLPESKMLNFITSAANADNTNTRYAKLNFKLNGIDYELYAHGGIYKGGADGWNYDYYMKENGVVLYSKSAGTEGGTSYSITRYIGSMPILITVGVSTYAIFGADVVMSCSVTSLNVIPTSYQITGFNYSGGSPFIVTDVSYSTSYANTKPSIYMPSIRIV